MYSGMVGQYGTGVCADNLYDQYINSEDDDATFFISEADHGYEDWDCQGLDYCFDDDCLYTSDCDFWESDCGYDQGYCGYGGYDDLYTSSAYPLYDEYGYGCNGVDDWGNPLMVSSYYDSPFGFNPYLSISKKKKAGKAGAKGKAGKGKKVVKGKVKGKKLVKGKGKMKGGKKPMKGKKLKGTRQQTLGGMPFATTPFATTPFATTPFATAPFEAEPTPAFPTDFASGSGTNNLTGIWLSSSGQERYRITQIGTTFIATGVPADYDYTQNYQPGFSNLLSGTAVGNTVSGVIVDLPRGNNRGVSNFLFEISSDGNTLTLLRGWFDRLSYVNEFVLHRER